MTKVHFYVLISFLAFSSALGQNLAHAPEYYSGNSFDLIRTINTSKRAALDRLQVVHGVRKDINDIARGMKYMVADHYFIKDSTAESYLLGLIHGLQHSSQIDSLVTSVLIVKSLEKNAFSTGMGIIVVTAGLLAQVESEDELLSVLAHELAHEYKGHVVLGLLSKSAIENRKDVLTQVELIRNKRMTVDDIEYYQDNVYSSFNEKRNREIEADTIGLGFLRSGGYSESAMIKAWEHLDGKLYPDFGIGEKLLLPFYFKEYPFQEEWLAIYVSERVEPKTFLYYHLDSLKTHPESSVRVEILKSLLGQAPEEDTLRINEKFQFVRDQFRYFYLFESLEAERLDLAMHMALMLKRQYLNDDYINLKIARFLVDLAKAQEANELHDYISFSTDKYGTEITLINSFLFNTSAEDKQHLAFHFLNNKRVFNPEMPEYYELLILTCIKLKKQKMREQVEQAYLRKFTERALQIDQY